MLRQAVFVSWAIPAVLAQYGGGSTSKEPSQSVSGVHVVKVGDGGLVFDPPEVKAAAGEVVEFHFYPKAHSVAQSSFDSPCKPLNTTGFFSGPVKVSEGVSEQVFSVTIEDEKKPLWYYCATGNHCQQGMVGVVNAPSNGRTLEQYSAAAANVEKNEAPSQTGGGVLGKAATARPSSAPTSTESTVPSAGVELRGDIRWGLMSLSIAVAGFIGGLMM